MSVLKNLAEELHRRSLWQILLVYAGVAYGILEAVDLFLERFALPDWFFIVAFLLLAVGLVVVVTTALVQPAAPWTEAEAVDAPADGRSGLRRLFTWRNATIAAGAAFALWGIVATGWLMVSQRADELTGEAVDLSAEPDVDRNRIAVLYFDDHSEGRVNVHLADAFTEALTHELSQVAGLDVLPRSAMKPYRDTAIPPDSIVQAYGAGTLVEGSVLGYGDSLRVTAQQIDANTMSHVTSVVVTGRRDAPLAVLQELAGEVSSKLRSALGKEIRLRERMAGTESNEAWELVHRAERQRDVAEQLASRGGYDAADQAADAADSLLALAEAADPDWIEPIVARGWVEGQRAIHRRPDPHSYDAESSEAGIAHANRALELSPGNAAALELRGVLYAYLASNSADADTLEAAAERDLRAAVLADTTRAIAYSRLGELLWDDARFDEAKLFAAKAYAADPYLENARVILFWLCQISIDQQEFGDAYRWCREGRRRYPNRPSFMGAELLLMTSVGPRPQPDSVWRLADAMLEGMTERDRRQQEPEILLDVAAGLARAGLPDSARAVIARARAMEFGDRPEVDYREAHARLLLGETDSAVGLLSLYLEAEPDLRDYIAEDWWWEPLRSNPGFRDLVGESP
jgi:TolB-like protein